MGTGLVSGLLGADVRASQLIAAGGGWQLSARAYAQRTFFNPKRSSSCSSIIASMLGLFIGRLMHGQKR